MNKSSARTRIIVRVAMLVAMAVVLKVFLSITTPQFRITFYDIPLMVTGIMFGPLYGLIGGFSTDVANIVFPNMATGFNLMTIESMMWGFIPALILYKKAFSVKRLIFAVVLTSIICFGINSVQLYIWFRESTLHWVVIGPRLLVLVGKLPVQVLIVGTLYYRVLKNDLISLEKKMGIS